MRKNRLSCESQTLPLESRVLMAADTKAPQAAGPQLTLFEDFLRFGDPGHVVITQNEIAIRLDEGRAGAGPFPVRDGYLLVPKLNSNLLRQRWESGTVSLRNAAGVASAANDLIYQLYTGQVRNATGRRSTPASKLRSLLNISSRETVHPVQLLQAAAEYVSLYS